MRRQRRACKSCHNCRVRKTKCDSQQPHCINCLSRRTPCVYPPDSRFTRIASQAAPNHQLASPSATISPTQLPESPRPAEQRGTHVARRQRAWPSNPGILSPEDTETDDTKRMEVLWTELYEMAESANPSLRNTLAELESLVRRHLEKSTNPPTQLLGKNPPGLTDDERIVDYFLDKYCSSALQLSVPDLMRISAGLSGDCPTLRTAVETVAKLSIGKLEADEKLERDGELGYIHLLRVVNEWIGRDADSNSINLLWTLVLLSIAEVSDERPFQDYAQS